MQRQNSFHLDVAFGVQQARLGQIYQLDKGVELSWFSACHLVCFNWTGIEYLFHSIVFSSFNHAAQHEIIFSAFLCIPDMKHIKEKGWICIYGNARMAYETTHIFKTQSDTQI